MKYRHTYKNTIAQLKVLKAVSTQKNEQTNKKKIE